MDPAFFSDTALRSLVLASYRPHEQVAHAPGRRPRNMVIAGKLDTVFVVHVELDRLAECTVCAQGLCSGRDCLEHVRPAAYDSSAHWAAG